MMTNQRQPIAVLILALAILCGAGLLLWQSVLDARQSIDKAKSADPQKGPVDEKTIRDLITELGDDSFDKREEATKRLKDIGEPARELVKKAATDNPDAEVRQRSEEILRALGFPALPVPDPLVLAKKPSFADAFRRSDIPAPVLAKMGSGKDDAPKELVAVLGKADGKHVVISLSLTADGRYLATGGRDESKAQIFDLKTGKLVKTFAGFAQQVRAVAISPNGNTLATAIRGSMAPHVSLWNTDTGVLQKSFGAHTNAVWGLAISPDGKLLASASWDRSVQLWDVATGAAVGASIMHGTTATCVAFSPDGKWLASASGTQQIRGEVIISDAATGRILNRGGGQAGEIRGLAWHPDGRSLASAAFDGTVWLWDVKTMKSTRVLGNATKCQAVAWHPSGQFLATNDHTSGAILLWDLRTPAPQPRRIQLFPADPKTEVWTHDVIFTPEGRHLIAGNPDGTVSVLRLAELGQVLK